MLYNNTIMWNRVKLKTRAKQVLTGNYWQAFVAGLVILLAEGSTSGSSGSSAASGGDKAIEVLPPFILGLIVLGVILFIALRIFIGFPLEVGGRKFFLRLSEGERKLGYIGHFFRPGYFAGVWKTMLLRAVYLILWVLLLVIPGIIKWYTYRMVPYILADNPIIGTKRAIELSTDMTDGQKFEMFVLDLSFIGWYILGLIALGIGVLFVQPYYEATYAELYLHLREHAIAAGITDKAELNKQ